MFARAWAAAGHPLPKTRNRYSYLWNEKLARSAVAALDLKAWRGATIVEMNPGRGVLSGALQMAVEPKQHILLEPNATFGPMLQQVQNESGGKVVHDRRDGYHWNTYTHLVDEGVLQPIKAAAHEINHDLLFVGNLLFNHGEQLVVQFMSCVAERLWLQKYGRVRMLLLVPTPLAVRFLTRQGEMHRNRIGVMAEAVADVQLVVHGPLSKATATKPLHLQRCPDSIPSYITDVHPSTSFCLLDITPLPENRVHCPWEWFDYTVKQLFVTRKAPIVVALDNMVAGGSELLQSNPHIASSKTVQDLSLSEMDDLACSLYKWPFRPKHLWTEMIDDLEKDRGIANEPVLLM